MLLKEFIQFTSKSNQPIEDGRYLSQNDTSVLKSSDTRKSRLTLKMINNLRKAAEEHNKEKREELSLIRKMYEVPAQPPA